MKKKVFTSISIVVVAVLYYFSISGLKGAENTNSTVSSTAQDTFTNTIFNTGYNVMLKKQGLDLFVNLDSFKELNFNAIQWYDWQGTSKYGKYDSSLSPTQISNFNSAISTVYNEGLLGFYERSYLSYYCYGQRLIYEVKPYNDNSSVNNGFVYEQCMENTYIMDGSRTVLHANPSTNNAGYLCKGIYENLQHTDLFGFRQSDEGLWYLKPVMKIPQNTHDTTRIVRIEIIPFDGLSTVKTIIIKAENFSDTGYVDNYIDLNPQLFINGKQDSLPCLSRGYSGKWWEWDTSCHVDFRVYWYGQCDVWFDKMIVDDVRANELFDTTQQNRINDRINAEVDAFANTPGNYSFFVDEVVMSQVPCMQYVISKMREYETKSRISFALTNALHIKSLKHDELSYGIFFDSLKPDFIQLDAHKFVKFSANDIGIPDVITASDELIPSSWFESESNYNNKLQNKVFGYKSENPVANDQGSLIYEINKLRTSNTNPLSNVKYIIQPHIHGYLFNSGGNPYYGGLREPTNEEIQAQAMISIAHGADGLCWYIYGSEVENLSSNNRTINGFDGLLSYSPNLDTILYTYALLDTNYIHRHKNCYGQDKWTYVSDMNGKINKWMEVLNNADWAGGYSVHQEGANYQYINDIRSKAPYINGSNPCVNYSVQGEYFDCTEHRYWEQGFFNPKDQSDKSKYFVMVNRRCVPPTQSAVGEIRTLRIKFNSLPDFNNWVLRDVYTNKQITFDKNNLGQGGYLNLGEDTSDIGYFQPGEGKLFQLLPVSVIGGTLVADETISGNVNCNGMIYNAGHNINISPNAVVTFSENAGIEMTGGTFTCGDYFSESPVTLKGKNESSVWNGLLLSNCSSIGIYNTNISKIHANDTAKGVMIYNCNNINIKRSIFNMGTNAGAIQAIFTENSDEQATFNISECNFYMGNSGYDAISITSNASYTLPVIIDWCNFATGNENSFAVRLIGVTGGAIKNSTFVNYEITLNAMSSAIDLYGNKMLGNNDSKGIECSAGSQIFLSPTSGQYLGGYNYIKNYGTSASNVYSNNSYFNIQNGQNDFDLSDIDNSKHLTGDLSGIPCSYVNATKNCFHKDSITNIDATHSVIWNSSSDPVNFVFTDYSCELTPPGDYFVYQYGSYNDTVYYRAGGEGSGFNSNKPMNIEENVYKSLKDSININLRKRNYLTVEDKAKQILTQYPDSLESASMVQKLYMASLSLDSTKIGITKTFLENLIATNTQNPTLIKRVFYFIQKCKVKLGQFQSALDGFQYIMTQNPYTYEGLIASWDYAATYLLMGTGGSYKGDLEQTIEELNTPADTLLNRMTKRDIKTNKTQNYSSTEQVTKTFYEKIKNVTKDDKAAQEEKVKTLEKKIEITKSKTEKNDAEIELAKMKQIKEVVKLKKPNTVMTHTAILNSDIKKVFGIGKKNSNETTNIIVPQTYALYQNYPNPFNPVTKISFSLPKESRVKLIIYDILGREVKRLLNNEIKSAGTCIEEFNGINFSSGVYFLRILVNDGKDFSEVKKMVLLK